MKIPPAVRNTLAHLKSEFEAVAATNLRHVLVEIPYPAPPAQEAFVIPRDGNHLDRLRADAFLRGQLVAAGSLERADTEATLAVLAQQSGLPEAEAAEIIRSGVEAGFKMTQSYLQSPYGKAAQEAENAVQFVFARTRRLIREIGRHTSAIHVFFDDEFDRGKKAYEAFCPLAELVVEILATHKLLDRTEGRPDPSEPHAFEAIKNHSAKQWVEFVHRFARDHPGALPRSASAPYLAYVA